MFAKIFIVSILFYNIFAQQDMGFDPRCPEVDDPIFVVHLPHESYCEYFYKCSNRHIFLFPCPPGLHWSIEHDRCEWPWIANCDPAGLPPIPTTTQVPGGNDCPDIDDPQRLVFLPDPRRCNGYFLCFKGNKISRTCATGLTWDRTNEWCDLDGKVPCMVE